MGPPPFDTYPNAAAVCKTTQNLTRLCLPKRDLFQSEATGKNTRCGGNVLGPHTEDIPQAQEMVVPAQTEGLG